MDVSSIQDILQGAEVLVAKIHADQDLPRVVRNIPQLLAEGEQLRSRVTEDAPSREQADVHASILLGSRGVDLPKLSHRVEGLPTTIAFGPLETIQPTDIEGFLRNERQTSLLAVIADTAKTTQEELDTFVIQAQKERWENEKRKIIACLEHCADTTAEQRQQSFMDTLNFTMNGSTSYRPRDSSILAAPGTPAKARLSPEELQYSKALTDHNAATITGALDSVAIIKHMTQVAEQLELRDVASLWQLLQSMQSRHSIGDDDRLALVMGSRRFLETKHLSDLRATVHGNLNKAFLGGAPSVSHLIRAYLNVKPVPPTHPGEPMVDGHPAWAMIYHALRCGDFGCAREIAMKSSMFDLAGKFEECQRDAHRRLSDDSIKELRLKFARDLSGEASHPYQRVVFGVLAGCEVPMDRNAVASEIEDYLWIKLCQVISSSSMPQDSNTITLRDLQCHLTEHYGEGHFDAYQRPIQYAYVLLLSAQFELAIEFLYRFDAHKCHAVHIAIALSQLGLIKHAKNGQDPLLVKDNSGSYLNFPRLITSYTLRFEHAEPELALEYYYTLKDKYESVWIQCVKELVLDTKEFAKLLGKRSPDGGIQRGAIDKFVGDRREIVTIVAEAAEARGLNEEAVGLFDLGGEKEKCVELLTKLLALQVTQAGPEGSKRHQLQKMANQLATFHPTPCLLLLIDLMTFYDLYYIRKNEEALELLRRLHIVPLSTNEVDSMVDTFCGFSEQVRRVIPDVLVTVMTILTEQYRAIRRPAQRSSMSLIPLLGGGSEKKLELIKTQANAIIKYAGMVPYRLPAAVNARLVQMEASMA